MNALLGSKEGFITRRIESEARVLGCLLGELGDGKAPGLFGGEVVAYLKAPNPGVVIGVVPVNLLDDLIVIGEEPSLYPTSQALIIR